MASRPYERAYAEFRAGEAALREGDRGGAQNSLRSALRTLDELGAAALAAKVRALARAGRIDLDEASAATHAAPGATARDHLARLALTPREREILALVAAGRSDGEIASELFISKKTASVHVANIKGKLGATSRIEIALMASRLGLVTDPA